MMKEVVIVNNKEYFILSAITINEEEYYVLVNSIDSKDMCIRKRIIENNEEYFVGLKDEEEFNKIMEEYKKKVEQVNDK